MTTAVCGQPIAFDALIAYWLGELAPDKESAVEEHYLGCGYCAQQLQELADLASSVRAAVRGGALRAVITPRFLDAMKRRGMRVREYRVAPGEGVACTIRMDEDVVVGRMQAPLAGVTRVDLLERIDLGEAGIRHIRMEDVPFDSHAGELLMMPSAVRLKAMPAHSIRVQLLAIEPSGERALGEYTFSHSPS